MSPEQKNRPTAMTQLAPYMGLGMQLAAAMAVFGALGWWLDGQFGTSPWLLAIGTLLGAAGGMISIIRASARLSKRPNVATPDRDSDTGHAP